MPRYGRVVLGGTFDRLHVGHEALLATAFRAGRTVAIGLTTDGYLERHPKPGADRVRSYRARRTALRRWLLDHYPRRRWVLVPLENTFGRSVEDGVDALVISADTLVGGRAVNDERRRLGRSAVPLVVVPLVLADDLGPVSSRRIRLGEIDRFGARRSPLRIGVAVADPVDHVPVVRGVRRAFHRARVQRIAFPAPGLGSPTRLRAAAERAASRRDLGVAVGVASLGRRHVTVAGPSTVLGPETIETSTAPELTAAVRGVLRRSDRTKRFNPRRK